MRDTLVPLHMKDLNKEQKNTILEYQLFLKEKRYGTLKSRKLAGVDNLIDFIIKKDNRSPTVTTESVLLTYIVDTENYRYVITLDITNAFEQTHIKDDKDTAIINIRGVLVDIMLEIAPYIYVLYGITNRTGVKQLIFQYQNAIYLTMSESLVYYNNFKNSLEN